jgi:arylsulfatase A-like enzyme
MPHHLHVSKTGIWEDTLTVLISDNGGTGLGSNWPLRGAKFTLWEGGTRSVALVRGWGLGKDLLGSSTGAIMHTVDWLATFARVGSGGDRDRAAAVCTSAMVSSAPSQNRAT